jgi:hypothetical protein
MSLFEELIEDREEDEKIIKSFETKDDLSSNIWEFDDKRYKMKDDVRFSLLRISEEFIESLGVDFFVHDIVLTGSLSNYNWSDFSDLDLHIIIDYDESEHNSEILKEFFNAKKDIWNEKHNIKIKGFDVELYVQDMKEPHVSSGVYSILNKKWVLEPEQKNPKIDDRLILQKGEYYAKKIDKLIILGNKNNVLSKIDELRKKLKSFRQSGLDVGGEYSYENLTFKLLRRNGYIGKLLNLKNKLIDKKLSLTQ